MNLIGWNCRGLGKPRTVRVLNEMVKSHKPSILFLSETLAEGKKIEEVAMKIGFSEFYSVDRIGRSGGLAVFWKRNVRCTVMEASQNHIDLKINESYGVSWRLTCYYGFPERERRKDAWNFLRSLASKSQLPWCIFGDFNDLLYSADKKGRNPHPQSLLEGFKRTIEDLALTEVELKGGKFTWEKSKGTSDHIRERLDRTFASEIWWQKYPLCTLTVLHAVVSDHEPIKLELLNTSISKKQFRFKFENTWLKEKSFSTDVEDHWKQLPAVHLLPKLTAVSAYMAKWGRVFFHKFRDKVVQQKMIVEELKDREDDDGIQHYFDEKEKLNELLYHEELYWKQRAKTFWLEGGDTNSKFFHAAATSRRKLNHISALRTDDGTIVTKHEELCSLLKNYYTKVFDEGEAVTRSSYTGNMVKVDQLQNTMLTADLNFEEFTEAVKGMHPDKASGPDGLNPAFFQHFWKVLGMEVFKCCKNWLNECRFSSTVNDTTLVLIPKKENVEEVKDLRPIALCNVLYKIIAKVLSNRLQRILPVLISEEQSAFVPGRHITDNVLVAFELLHFMKRKNRGQEGEVALKLDISKAYDRVSWQYLRSRMEAMGFDQKWVNWIMLCVSTVSYSISFQGSMIGPIIPRRGLRQGDPLSPYLFLLCVEGLSLSLKSAAHTGVINGCCISPNAPSITHLLFADDSFLFFKATTTEAHSIKEILNRYEAVSGQAVNYQKSAIFFSANVHRDKQSAIKQFLGVFNDVGDTKYLGLPSLIGRSKKTVFRYLKDKIFQRIQGWGSKLLSRAGKAVMIRNVAQTIPSYAMSCFLIPKTLCQEMERLMNDFWWKSNSNNSKGIKWLAWDKMSMTKKKGGLGFRNLHGFNLSLLGKQCWNLIEKPNALLSRVLKARYYPDCHLIHARRIGGASYTWSGLWEAKEEIKKGLRWVLGDGQSINIYSDRWLRNKENLTEYQDELRPDQNSKVCEFFLEGKKEWDVQKIRRNFNVEDTEAIIYTRIPQSATIDRLAWCHSYNGQYTVKSGYQQWQKTNMDDGGIQDSRGWSRIWRLQIPHKMRIFLWRMCRNNIPIRNLLRGKGIGVPIGCAMCVGEVEHLLHLFYDCRYAQECWNIMELQYNMWEVESAPMWLLDKLSTEVEDKLVKIAAVLWGVWFARNKKIFEGRSIHPAGAMSWSMQQIEEWKAANRKKDKVQVEGTTASAQQELRWNRPREGTFKLNVDASVKQNQDHFAVGMVLRNHEGRFVAGKAARFRGVVQVLEAEVMAIFEALKWLEDMHPMEVMIESDSLLAVRAMNKEYLNYMELGTIVKQCKEMIASKGNISIHYIKRQANKVAHELAKIPCEPNSFVVIQSPPDSLLETILSDAMII